MRYTLAVLFTALCLTGCSGGGEQKVDAPSFTLAWSEYPSWSVFGVADELGIIDGDQGELGEVEKKYGVDIVLKEASYDSCINLYSSKNVDAVCLTNMDSLIVADQVPAISVMPTSTSDGADACIVVDIADLEALKEHKAYGLENTVSHYLFNRYLSDQGMDPADFQFTNKDPAVAAQAMQTKDASTQAIVVWNPFVLQTLSDRPEAKVLFDSSSIPGEIVDMIILSKESAKQDGADKFALAIMDTFYEVGRRLESDDTQEAEKTLVMLGEKFSRLDLEQMKTVVQQTKFYKNPKAAIDVLGSDEFKSAMEKSKDFCVKQELTPDEPKYSFSESEDGLEFSTKYLEDYQKANE